MNNYTQFDDLILNIGGFPLMSLPTPLRYIAGTIIILLTAPFFVAKVMCDICDQI